ncbi:MAG: hypothetical protein IPN08_15955 [Bacteroidales bacterium]|nr:hypothetical protein [Bacteroidales bacterium]
MKIHFSLLLLLIFNPFFYKSTTAQPAAKPVVGWNYQKLNTAVNETYMTKAEKEMILEINKVRSNPKKYAEEIEPLFEKAVQRLKTYGKGVRSATYQTTIYTADNRKSEKVDTIWLFKNEEEVKAIESLIKHLNHLRPLSVLQPSNGIYLAARKHAIDQVPSGSINHVGTDNSWPWDRIRKSAPTMKEGNENIACGSENARDIVIQLLIDSGIPGYGHRETLLDSRWTHCACYCVGKIPKGISCTYWIQNFGTIYSF